jgi:hypothetical protein
VRLDDGFRDPAPLLLLGPRLGLATLHWQAIERWLAANPDDPDAAEIRARHKREKRVYLRHGRDVLGWAIFVGWKRP